MLLRSVLISMCLTGLLAGQTPPAPTRGRGIGPGFGRGLGAGFGPGAGGNLSERRLTAQLALDAAQQNAVHSALVTADVQRKGMNDRARELRSQLATAVKAGDEGSIDRISQDIAALHQQETAIQAKTLSKIYNALNADQKARFEREMNRSLGVPRTARGVRNRPAQQ